MSDDPTTEARILDAAHRVFVRRGLDGARMQEIADEAGVNKALLHYYFRSKERLSEAVFLRAASSLFPRMAAALTAEAPVEARVREAVAVEMEFLRANPYLPGYILSEVRTRPERFRQALAQVVPVEALRAGLLGGLQQQLDREAAAGALRPARAEDVVVNLIALIVFPFAARPMLELVLGLDDAGFDAFLDRRSAGLADFILNALRP